LSRFAIAVAWQLSQPGEMRSQPVVGFHVISVHSIVEALNTFPYSTVCATPIAHSYMAFHQRK